MKRLICILLALCISIVPCISMAEEVFDVEIRAVAETVEVEVGDQFIVNITKTVDDLKFLTFRINGEFDSEFAEMVAPVYTNERLGILKNDFDNEKGTFTFEGYDMTISGTDENIICSLLFVAKKSGEFNVTLLNDCMLGKHDENAFYNLAVLGTSATDTTVKISEDTDGAVVSLIKDPDPLTPYDDMFGYDWAEKAVGVMYELGVLEDIADTSYYPGEKITRGDFVTMLVRVCKLKNKTAGEPFLDVASDSYQYDEIMTAKALGIAKGYGDGNFRPDDYVTREEICAFVYRTMLKMNKVNPEIEPDEYLEKFSDKGEITPYAVEGVAGLIRAKILVGDDQGLIRPADNMTRAEAAVLLNRLAEFNILISR